MTTRSSPPQSGRSVVALTEEAPWAGPPGEPAGDQEGEHADGDPAPGPAHAAAPGRPPEDILRLVTLLEESPAVRAAVGPRSADELAEAVARLTRDSSREPHSRQRPFPPGEEPMTGPAGYAATDARAAGAAVPGRADRTGATGPDDRTTPPHEAETFPLPGAGAFGRAAARLAFWPGWVAAAALVVCAAAHFPLHREGAPPLVYGLALAASALCAALAVALVLRAGVVVLVAGSVVPAVLAALGYVEGRFAPRELSHALSVTVAPPAGAGLTAVCASLASLAALSLLLMVHIAERHPTPRPGD
ncbi:hypothetical protein HUT11_08550 [Streptomyces seoulensis]|nr:hypothetical protein HUT11_08550 [Streptomyces seoulensis]